MRSPRKKKTTAVTAGTMAAPVNLGRHEAQCTVCKHPGREEMSKNDQIFCGNVASTQHTITPHPVNEVSQRRWSLERPIHPQIFGALSCERPVNVVTKGFPKTTDSRRTTQSPFSYSPHPESGFDARHPRSEGHAQ